MKPTLYKTVEWLIFVDSHVKYAKSCPSLIINMNILFEGCIFVCHKTGQVQAKYGNIAIYFWQTKLWQYHMTDDC